MDDDQGSEDDNMQPQNIVTEQKDNTRREPSSYPWDLSESINFIPCS